jgi:hypothetical protein
MNFEDGGGTSSSTRCRLPLETGKGKATGHSLEPAEEMQLC